MKRIRNDFKLLNSMLIANNQNIFRKASVSLFSYLPIALLLTFTSISLCFANTEKTESVAEQEIHVGVLAYRDRAQTIERWQHLTQYLTQQIADYRFTLVAGNYPELEKKIEQGEIDFLLTQPSHYVSLTYKENLTSPLASMVNKEVANGYAVFGGVIFTKSDRQDINQLTDIKGKMIVTPSKKSLGAYQMQAFELLNQEIFSHQKEMKVIETGLPQLNAIHAVLRNEADVGFVRSGVIEKLIERGELKANQLKILNPQSFADFNLIVSTQLYPEWPIASFAHVKQNLMKEVLQALLKIERDSELAIQLNISGFTIAEDYRNIDQLLRKLNLPPFHQSADFTLLDIWHRWQVHIVNMMVFIMVLTLIMLLYLFHKNKSLKEITLKLKDSHQQIKKLDLAIQQSPVRIFITNADNKIEYANEAVQKQSGYPFEEFLLKDPNIFSSGDMPKSMYENLWKTVLAGDVWVGDIINKSKQGEKQVLKTTITQIKDPTNSKIGYLCIQKDITEEKETEKKIHQLSYYDELTGLPNRNQLEIQINDIIADNIFEDLTEADSSNNTYLMLVNIDRFKMINDANGKLLGNDFLKQFSVSLRESVSPKSFVARLAADEFAIVCSSNDESSVDQLVTQQAENLLNCLKKPFCINDQQWNVSVSIGIAPIACSPDTTVNEVLRHADTALHYAKAEGGNQIQLFDRTIEQKVTGLFKTEQDLKIAIQDQQFELYYQPQVTVSGVLSGAEALIRWQHPQQGTISPDKFTPIAEQSDLIIDIGHWVLQEACQQLSQASNEGFEYDLSVNISPRQFMNPDFGENVMTLIEQYSIDPERLTLEITEGLFLNDIEKVLPVMQALADTGIKFSIDDFGTGFSSLGYLKNLPINELKIDRMFVKNVYKDNNDAMLVDTIISIAEHMRFSVVAEGVETSQQSRFFDRFPNIRLQGYKYGKPLCYGDFESHWHKK